MKRESIPDPPYPPHALQRRTEWRWGYVAALTGTKTPPALQAGTQAFRAGYSAGLSYVMGDGLRRMTPEIQIAVTAFNELGFAILRAHTAVATQLFEELQQAFAYHK